MKLISCYIENFGGLSRFSLEFDAGVTVIHAPNGFGKTTLAEFLRAMLYGFPRKAKTLDKSRRQKYTPWNGGKFGGNLVFEYEGICYRLERTFGATPAGDTFALIDLESGKRSNRFSKEIGQELFQLDADSFERSTYMPQLHDNSSLTTASIQTKLTRLVEDTGDINNYDKAVVALKSARSSFIPYRGSGGSVAETVNQISRVQQELDRAKSQEWELKQCTAQIVDTEEKILRKKSEIEENRKRWEQASKADASRQQYNDLRARYNAASEQLRALEERYPAGIPGDQELDQVREIAEKKAALENSGLSAGERARYDKLRSDYDAGLLSETRLAELAERNRNLLRQRAALENLTVPEEERHRMEQLNSFFTHGIPEEEEIRNHRRTMERCDALRRENAQLEARSAVVAPSKRNILLLVFGAVGIVLGAVLMILEYYLAGGTGLAVGTALLALGAVYGTGQRRDAQRDKMELLRQIDVNEKAITSGEGEVQAFIRSHGLSGDAYEALEEIRRRRDEALNLREMLRLLEEKRAVRENLARQAEETLRSQLGSDDFDSAISDLRLSREQVLRWMQQEEQLERKLTVCGKELDAFFNRFGLRRGWDLRRQLQQIHDDGILKEDALRRQKELAEQLQQFPDMPEDWTDLESLKRAGQWLTEEHAALTESLLKYRQQRSELQYRVDQIPELTDELARWQEQKTAHQRKARILDDTMDFLSKARESLTTSYLGPIRESFDGYLTCLTAGQKETVFITPELQVQMERQGQARELAYFSTGQTDLVMLCMRLSLVDALFREEKPFVILDDPFVNLDDERTAEALRLLEKLGEERQIIYLTCSSSRRL